MKASFKATYQTEKGAAAATSAAATFTFNAGDIKLRASLTDATIVHGPSLNGLALAVEKPGFFIVDYNVPKQDVKFQFMNAINIKEKQLSINYTHGWEDNVTALDGTLELDSASKVSAYHVLGTRNCKFKYTYVHGGLTTFEPSYEWGKNSWDFVISRKVYGDDLLKASYETSSKHLGLEWSRNNPLNGSFKIAALFNLAEEQKFPKLIAESSWDFDE